MEPLVVTDDPTVQSQPVSLGSLSDIIRNAPTYEDRKAAVFQGLQVEHISPGDEVEAGLAGLVMAPSLESLSEVSLVARDVGGLWRWCLLACPRFLADHHCSGGFPVPMVAYQPRPEEQPRRTF